jgi:hypothetical protein
MDGWREGELWWTAAVLRQAWRKAAVEPGDKKGIIEP